MGIRTFRIIDFVPDYIHTYIDYAMNHKNKQIYSNREGANGSHRINDHLRVSTISWDRPTILAMGKNTYGTPVMFVDPRRQRPLRGRVHSYLSAAAAFQGTDRRTDKQMDSAVAETV